MQRDKTAISGSETAAVEVERTQMVIEVDVQPLATGRPSLPDGNADKLGSDALPPHALGDQRVKDERMDRPVPDHIHEADESAVASGAYPAETVLRHRGQPVIGQDGVFESLSVQLIQGVVVEVVAHS